MDPDTARRMAEQGAAVLMLGVPPGCIVGVDHQAFAAGPKFKGIKMLPPGTHFFSCRATSGPGGGEGGGPGAAACAPPTSFFAYLAPRQVLVKVWDAATEQLVALTDEDEAERYVEGVRRYDFDAYLAPYDGTGYPAWARVSGHISRELVDALSPAGGGGISIAAEAVDSELAEPKTEAERRLVQQLADGRARLAARMQQRQQEHQLQGEGGLEGSSSEPGVGVMDVEPPVGASTEALTAAGPAPMDTESQPSAADNVRQRDQAAAGAAEASTAAEQQKRGGGGDAAGGPAAATAAAETGQTAASGSGRCFYTRLPRLVKQRGLSAEQLTAANLDKSSALLQAAEQRYGAGRGGGGGAAAADVVMDALLGELQFAFIAFVFGQSLDGFAQWKSLLTTMLACEDAALHAHQPSFVRLLAAVRAQLALTLGPSSGGGSGRMGGSGAGEEEEGGLGEQEAPFGLPMVEELLPDSFLRRAFGSFFRMLQENDREVSAPMQREAQALKQLLRSKLGWEYDFRVIGELDDEEDEEDLPVVVDTNEPYAL